MNFNYQKFFSILKIILTVFSIQLSYFKYLSTIFFILFKLVQNCQKGKRSLIFNILMLYFILKAFEILKLLKNITFQ